ncbi:superoxide dismutase [Ectobacillus antri]|jgi:Fe-Mn family superoxide dismutase|uniref:superoxide dismutase n=1 Tax=Ectobacillus antri TaxID=2486280 RepID=A0ABT6H287_9BACI|nr:superoxide dismutase [Ectobacillus antri]MDG4656052.1 superoxide dismutase [Ectobacillus antri]MDG5752727.1 superoxide dismutase [Ectobacillus antri]
MNQQEVFNHYFDEVEHWCESVLHVLDSRAIEIYDVHMLEYRIQVLLDRIKANEFDYNVEFVYQISDDVDNIQGHLQEVFVSGHYDEYAMYERNQDTRSVPIGGHTLPPLPYAYNALEPYIAKEIMRLHHDKHHRSYVDGLNKAEKMMQMARETNNFELIKHWEREAAFHGSGHYLHTTFWENMKRGGGGRPGGKLLRQIESDFGNFDKFKKHFTEAANKVEGSGWAILVWAPRSGRLEILQSTLHQLFTQWDTIPLLVLDVWEHAYYLQYQNRKEEYVNSWWNVVNWGNVEERFEKARKIEWEAY